MLRGATPGASSAVAAAAPAMARRATSRTRSGLHARRADCLVVGSADLPGVSSPPIQGRMVVGGRAHHRRPWRETVHMVQSKDTPIYRNILVNMADGVISLDLEGCITTFNPAAGQILGLRPEEVIGRLYAEIFLAEPGLDAFNELIIRAIYESETTHSQAVDISLKGRERHLEVSTTYLRSDETRSGARLGVIVVFSDATERRTRQRIQSLFGAYLDPRIVERIIQEGDLESEGVRREMTILFCDLKGFTRTAEKLTAEQLIQYVNLYLAVMSEPVARHRGVTDKYIGDAIMAFWGPPFSEADSHAVLACRAALEQRRLVAELRRRVAEEIGPIVPQKDIDIYAGIATGDVVAGSIGPRQSRSYTVIGNAVNLASRLESSSKSLGGGLLVSEATWASAKQAFEFKELEPLALRGRSKPERVFELVAER
ncbi:MAG: adenylate/guanylate cyclase domain-containing protein [Alphaproteobacteria bacterium]